MMNSLNPRVTPESQTGVVRCAERGRVSRVLWMLIWCVVILYLPLLVVELAIRGAFPWDFLNWSESPFMVDMMKLSNHQPVYTAPLDMNSFVYSPGLAYVTFALLKPLGLALDIRFCRLVIDLIAMLAAVAGMLTIRQLVRSTLSKIPGKSIWFVTWGVLWLVISTNFLSDVPHPDSVQALHALTVFWLCFTALQTKRFKWAVAAVMVAGVGVFSKQTGASSVFGAVAVFALFNPWGWRRWLLLTGLGGLMLGVSLYLVWLPVSGRFFTLDLLASQKIELARIVPMLKWLLARRRGVLVCLTVISVWKMWQAGGASRNYLACWAGLGFFSVGPNSMAYLKVQGMNNNLALFEIWMFLLSWPAFLMLRELWDRRVASLPGEVGGSWKIRAVPLMFQCLIGLYLLALVPFKQMPMPEESVYCRKVEAAVRQDIQSGKKVLLTHGTMFLINSGVTEPPRDRVITSLEYLNGKKPELFSAMKTRIVTHEYDKVYLAGWYGNEMQDLINQNYSEQSVFKHSRRNPLPLLGLGGVSMPNYDVLSSNLSKLPIKN